MSRIRVLPEAVAARIAAGEVVERPASIVKELVENSLDAGARRVDVTLEAGGKSLVRVIDDGCGMDRDDALLCFEQHATSKVDGDFDLASLSTFGFRGEALAAIGACARVDLTSAVADGEATRVRVEHGRLASVDTVGAPRGTKVEVRRLFERQPARRKFLRSGSTELSHVLRFLELVALARPELHLTLDHGGRELLALPPAGDVESRVVQLLGREFADSAVRVTGERSGISVSGWIARPGEGSGRFGQATLVVNGRAVSDRVLSHALREASRTLFGVDRAPAGILLVDLPPGDVDVNVHPAKREVRFARPWEVHDAVRDVVRGEAVRRGFFGPAPAPTGPEPTGPEPTGPEPTGSEPTGSERGTWEPVVAEGAAPRPPWESQPAFERVATDGAAPAGAAGERSPPPGPQPWLHDMAARGEPGAPGAPAGRRVLGQHRNTYVIAEDEQGLVLIDQHCAHERVLFERLIASIERDVPRQALLEPVVVELPRRLLPRVEERASALASLGFEVEPFGEGAVAVRTVPEVAGTADPAELLRELLARDEDLPGTSRDDAPLARVRKLAATIACKAAVKAGHPLPAERLRWIVDALFETEVPTTCPHGRVAILRLTDADLDRRFGRSWSSGGVEPRGERRDPPRGERRDPPRGERRDPPRGERGEATRGERGEATRGERGAEPRGERRP